MAGEHAQGEQLKTLKVSVPTEYHLHLHRLKVLTGTTISDTVGKALRAYFEHVDVPELS